MLKSVSRIQYTHFTIWLSTFLLIIFGGVTVFATTFPLEDVVSDLFYKQIFFYILTLIGMIAIALIDYRVLFSKRIQFLFIILNTILLLVVLVNGQTINGATRWIDIGGFLLQPAEFSKLINVIVITDVLVKPIKNKIDIVWKGFQIVSILFSLILIFKQNSLGNTVIMTMMLIAAILIKIPVNKKSIISVINICLGSLLVLISLYPSENTHNIFAFICGLFGATLFFGRKNVTVIILSFVALLSPFVLFFASSYGYNEVLEDYQRDRIEVFFDSGEDKDTWNHDQSKLAFSSGGLLGEGFLQCKQVNFGLLPFPYTDFAFACIGQQFGFLGSTVTLAIYLLLIWNILSVGRSTKDPLGIQLAITISFLFLFHIIQHVGMNMGLLPITGMTLPFISYGGSSIIMFGCAIGVVQSMNIQHYFEAESIVKIQLDN